MSTAVSATCSFGTPPEELSRRWLPAVPTSSLLPSPTSLLLPSAVPPPLASHSSGQIGSSPDDQPSDRLTRPCKLCSEAHERPEADANRWSPKRRGTNAPQSAPPASLMPMPLADDVAVTAAALALAAATVVVEAVSAARAEAATAAAAGTVAAPVTIQETVWASSSCSFSSLPSPATLLGGSTPSEGAGGRGGGGAGSSGSSGSRWVGGGGGGGNGGIDRGINGRGCSGGAGDG